MEITPDTPLAVKIAHEDSTLSLTEFFKAWGILVPVIAERLRRAGYNGISANKLRGIKSDDHLNYDQRLMLRIIIRELKNDIEKLIIYK